MIVKIDKVFEKDTDKIKKGMEELTQASHKLAEEIYKQAQAKQQQQAQAGAEPGRGAGPQPGPQPRQEELRPKDKKKEDIIDAEYKPEDDNK